MQNLWKLNICKGLYSLESTVILESVCLILDLGNEVHFNFSMQAIKILNDEVQCDVIKIGNLTHKRVCVFEIIYD